MEHASELRRQSETVLCRMARYLAAATVIMLFIHLDTHKNQL